MKKITLVLLILLLFCGTASAWWDASWNEREHITITGTRDDSDCIVELIIDMGDYSDKIRADGYDIRFVNKTTNTTIPAHDFIFNHTGNSTYYIKTNITTAGTEIYMYYNNSAASSYFDASPIYVTMDRFNRGDSGTIGTAEVGGTWTEVETCSITSNELYESGTGAGNAAYAYIINTSVSSYSGGISQMRTTSSVGNDEVRFYVNGGSSNQQAVVTFMNGFIYYADSIGMYNHFSPQMAVNNDRDYIISIQHNNAASYSVWVDGVKKVTDSSYHADVAWLGYFVPCVVKGSGTGVGYFDNSAKFNKIDFGATYVIGTAPPIISNKQPSTPISKYINSSNFEINVTISETTDNKWEIDGGTGYILKEWDNATVSPAYMFSPGTEGIGDHGVKLTAYNTSTGKDINTMWDVKISYAWDRTLISQFDMCLCYYGGNLLCGDIDNDGSEECFAVGRDANQLVILETDSTNRTYDVQDPYMAYWNSLKDIDGDGQNEVIYTYASLRNGNEGETNLYQFNSTHINQSNVNNIMGVPSDNIHGVAWMLISGQWRFFSANCGHGEITNVEINFTGYDDWHIDTVAGAGEDAVVFDIDQDGVDELVVSGGFAPRMGRVYVYEINNVTGDYTAKTMILDKNLRGDEQYGSSLCVGDIDNDGIPNLIVSWMPEAYTNPIDGFIEAYEFNTSYASGYEEGFEIAHEGTGFLEHMECRIMVADVDGDGNNELLTGQAGYLPDNRQVHLSYYDVGTDGADITKHILYNFTDWFGSAYYTWTVPAMINDGGTMKVACMVINETHSDFFLFEKYEIATPPTINISCYSKYPETLYTNYTGFLATSYMVESNYPLNLSSLAFLMGTNYTLTSDYHSYLKVPPNSITDDGIYRAHNRNTTPHMYWESNDTITEGNVWKWGGGTNEDFWITNKSINATHTWVNITGRASNVFPSMFYLGRKVLHESEKTGIEIHRGQGIIFKIWDLEQFRGRSHDYYLNLFFDTQMEADTTRDIEIWYCNDSFNPNIDDPRLVCDYKDTWSDDRWINHSTWQPHNNVSYCRPLQIHAGTATCPSSPTEVNYIYLCSGTQASKSFILNATNDDPGICNLTYAETETMWLRNEISGTNTPLAYTPSFFYTFTRDYLEFTHHLYIANDQGTWGHSDYVTHPIGLSNIAPTHCRFNYFWWNGTTDYGMNGTYEENFNINLTYGFDPDNGASLTHVLSLYDDNYNFITFINDSLVGNQTDVDIFIDIQNQTTKYFVDCFRFKIVSTDNEASTSVTWSNEFCIKRDSWFKTTIPIITGFPAAIGGILTSFVSFLPLFIGILISGALILVCVGVFGKLKQW